MTARGPAVGARLLAERPAAPALQAAPASSARALLGRAEWIRAAAGGLALTASHGLHHIYSNQTQYFLLGFRLDDPGFVPRDWFVWGTTHHHVAFGYLVYALLRVGGLAVGALAIQTLLAVAACVALVLLTRRFCRHPVPVYLLLLSWLALSRPEETGLGGFYLLSPFLQPSGIAGALWLLGLAALFERRFGLAGWSLGVAGLFHAAILLTMAPVAVALALWTRPWRNRSDLTRLIVPAGLMWGIALVLVMRHGIALDPLALEGMRTQFFIRSPHHHLLALWEPQQTVSWLLWLVAGAWAMLRLPRSAEGSALQTVFAVSLWIVLAGLALAAIPETTVLALAKLNLLPTFRSATLPLLLGLLLLFDRWSGLYFEPHDESAGGERRFCALLIVVAAGGWLLAIPAALARVLRLAWLVALPILGGVARRPALSRRWVLSPSKLVPVLWVAVAALAVHGVVTRSTWWRPDPTSSVLAAIRTGLPEDAVLVTPVGMDRTRLVGQRAVVVDAKCFSVVPAESLEWYRRMCDVCGFAPVARRAPPPWDWGYRNLDTARARRLKERYGATHVVVERWAHRGDTTGLPEVYGGPFHRILRIP